MSAISAPIVLGFDGSPSAGAALAKTAELAPQLGAPVIVVFGYYISPLGGGDVRDYKQALLHVGEREARRAATALEAAGVEVSTRLVSAKPAEGILEVADEVDAQLIVVGSHGEGPIAGAVLGSVPYRLLHRSRVPVLVVPSGG